MKPAHRGALLLVLGALSFVGDPAPYQASAQPIPALKAEEIIERLAPPPAPRTRSLGTRAFKLEPRTIDFQIGFDFDSARIRPDSIAQLDEIARALQAERLSELRFRVEGHTDAAGTAAYNDSLSERRARAVVEFLTARHIDADRLKPEGRGMRELAEPRNPLSAANRRVRIVTID